MLNPNFFPTGTNLSLKVQARMEDKGRIKNLKSLFAFLEKFGRAVGMDITSHRVHIVHSYLAREDPVLV